MLTPGKRTGWARIAFVFVHVAILASGIAGLATFAVTMSEATPVSPDVASVVRDNRSEPQAPPRQATVSAPQRPVRVVYLGR